MRAEDIDNLTRIAEQLMRNRGLQPEFTQEELHQLAQIQGPAPCPPGCTDLRSLLWCSIDNDDSRDLDQLTYAEKGNDHKTTIWIAIADVSALVSKDSPIDQHAQINTTSVYTPTKIFSMLPEKLSTDLTSLNEGQDRMALVIRIKLNEKGEMEDSSISQAIVRNYAQLAYNAIGDWLAGLSNPSDKIKQVPGLESALRIQHEIAQTLRQRRHELGSLTLESPEIEAKISNKGEILLEHGPQNLAQQLIEEFMIAANIAIIHNCSKAKVASLRRVVRIPKRWDRIVEVANNLGEHLPAEPDSKALDKFLIKRRAIDPVSFPDLSLTIIKLLGRGEYIVENAGEAPIGHFGLALSDYTHATAPNRRFPDLIVQRQYKAYLHREAFPYALSELTRLAEHCTQQEDAATKVERQINKSAAAMLLSSQIGTLFKGIITGRNEYGIWVRIFDPAVEGKVIKGAENLDVGDRVSVRLTFVDIPRGYIDFVIA